MPSFAKPKELPADAMVRRCLMCGHLFPSEGIHNHICRKCRSSQRWRDGF